MHTLNESLLGFFGAKEMIENSAFNAECLFPAWRAFPHRIFEVRPQLEKNVIGIKNVSR